MRVLKSVNKRVDHSVSKENDNREVEKVGGKIGREAEVEHKIVDLVPGPAEDEAEGDKSQSLDGVAPSLVPPVALGLRGGWVRA